MRSSPTGIYNRSFKRRLFQGQCNKKEASRKRLKQSSIFAEAVNLGLEGQGMGANSCRAATIHWFNSLGLGDDKPPNLEP